MHVAAHVDAIERRILPLLAQGTTVLLDRFWWSTTIYADFAGVPPAQIKAMLDAEAASWKQVEPTLVFLIQRESPSVDEHLAKAYNAFATSEQRISVLHLNNSRDLSESVREAVNAIETTL
jgi:thymidylate kinase